MPAPFTEILYWDLLVNRRQHLGKRFSASPNLLSNGKNWEDLYGCGRSSFGRKYFQRKEFGLQHIFLLGISLNSQYAFSSCRFSSVSKKVESISSSIDAYFVLILFVVTYRNEVFQNLLNSLPDDQKWRLNAALIYGVVWVSKRFVQDCPSCYQYTDYFLILIIIIILNILSGRRSNVVKCF